MKLSDDRQHELVMEYVPNEFIKAATEDNPMIEMHLTAVIMLSMKSVVKQALSEQREAIADWLENKDGKGFSAGFSSYDNEAVKAAKQLSGQE